MRLNLKVALKVTLNVTLFVPLTLKSPSIFIRDALKSRWKNRTVIRKS